LPLFKLRDPTQENLGGQMLSSKSLIAGIVGSLFASTSMFAPVNASGLNSLRSAQVSATSSTLPENGTITVGEASWQFDRYGFAYGWDSANTFLPLQGEKGRIYYPMEFFFKSVDHDNYILCGFSGNDYSLAVKTTQANGDIVLTCPEYEINQNVGIFAQLKFRIYKTEKNGWLIREEAIITNRTNLPYNLSALGSYQYISGYVYGNSDDSVFLTSSSETLTPKTLGNRDSWFISSFTDGSSVTQTTAWAKTNSTETEDIINTAQQQNNDYIVNDYGSRSVPASGALHFVQYTNMNIPSPSSATSLASAKLQVAEFNTFSGRLTAGLDADTYYLGWGYPQTAPAVITPALVALQYENGSSTLSKSQKSKIKELVAKSGSNAKFVVTGTAGKLPGLSDQKVKALAKKRAQIVQAYLVKLGVKKSHITIKVKITNQGIAPKTKILARYSLG